MSPKMSLASNVLLSANGGCYLNEVCLNPDFNIYQCEVRLKECKDPLLPNTKCVLLLGELAAQEWLHNTENKIGEIRGSVYVINDIPHIASFSAQDCVDIKRAHRNCMRCARCLQPVRQGSAIRPTGWS